MISIIIPNYNSKIFIENTLNSVLSKSFKYMCSGFTFIVSNLHIWKSIIDKHRFIICIDEISDAFHYIFEYSEKALEIGKRGPYATKKIYNCEIEETKLFSIFSKIK